MIFLIYILLYNEAGNSYDSVEKRVLQLVEKSTTELIIHQNVEEIVAGSVGKSAFYLFSKTSIKTIDFSTENSTNTLLAQIVLCSVLYRYIKLPMWKQYSKYCKPIGDFFISCMSELSKENGVNVRQFCTIPQILLYITRAIKE